MESLTQEQLAYIERHGKSKNPKTIARDLKLELRFVQNALKTIHDPRPAATVVTPRFTTDALIGAAFAVAIVVLGWLAYANNLSAGWHFDDVHTVLSNEAIKNPTFAAIYKLNNYRQALYWVFAGSWALHGLSVTGWHIENNLIHILNGLLVYALAFLTLRTPAAKKQSLWPHTIAGIAGAIFVLHPVQTQAVTYITQRTESLCATFYLLALVLYGWARLRRVEGKATGTAELAAAPIAAAVGTMILAATFLGLAGKLGPFLVVTALAGAGAVAALVFFSVQKKADPIEAALFLGAMLVTLVACQTKEIAGTIPAAMILWELVFMRPTAPSRAGTLKAAWLERARAHVSVAPYATMLALLPILAVAVGLSVRLSLREGSASVYDIKEVTGKQYVLTQLNVLATYTRLYLLPWGQSLDYDYAKRSGLLDGPTLLSLAALVTVLALAVRFRRTQPVFTFAVFFMLGVLAPTTFFVLPDFIFEHRIYLPLAGAAFVTALLAERVLRAVVKDEALALRALVGSMIPVLAILLVLTRARNEVWATDETLWKDCADKAPKKPRPLTNLGLFYQNVEGQIVELKSGERVGGTFLDGAHPNINRPDVWVVTTNMPNPARQSREFTIPKSEVVKGPVEWGGLEKAEKIYLEALKIDDDYYKARNNYALAVIQRGVMALEKAKLLLHHFRGVLKEFGPDHPNTKKTWAKYMEFENEAVALFAKGEAELKEILRRHDDDNVSLMNLANLYFGYLDRLDDAITAIEKSIALDDKDSIIFAVAGEIYFSRAMEHVDAGHTKEAIDDYRRAIERYTRYLERAGKDKDPENYRHIQQRKDKAEKAIREGGARAEPKQDGDNVNAFQGPANGPARVNRWKPGQFKAGPK